MFGDRRVEAYNTLDRDIGLVVAVVALIGHNTYKPHNGQRRATGQDAIAKSRQVFRPGRSALKRSYFLVRMRTIQSCVDRVDHRRTLHSLLKLQFLAVCGGPPSRGRDKRCLRLQQQT